MAAETTSDDHRYAEMQDAPQVLQDLAEHVREEHHSTLAPANIPVVMTNRKLTVGGEEVAAKLRLADTPTRLKEGVHGWLVVNADWYDENDPRQRDMGNGDGDVNRRICMRVLDECYCSVLWEADEERLKRQPPVMVYKAVMQRWGPVPHTMEAEVAEVMGKRVAGGVPFLRPLD